MSWTHLPLPLNGSDADEVLRPLGFSSAPLENPDGYNIYISDDALAVVRKGEGYIDIFSQYGSVIERIRRGAGKTPEPVKLHY